MRGRGGLDLGFVLALQHEKQSMMLPPSILSRLFAQSRKKVSDGDRVDGRNDKVAPWVTI